MAKKKFIIGLFLIATVAFLLQFPETLAQEIPGQEIQPPANFTAEEIGAHYIKFTWDPVDQPEGRKIDQYYVACKSAAEYATQAFAVVGKVDSTQTNFTWVGLELGTTYYCGVGSEDISYCKSVREYQGGLMYEECRREMDAEHMIRGGISSTQHSPIDGLTVTTKEIEETPLVVTEEVAEEIVTTSGEIPVLTKEQVTSVGIEQSIPVVTGTKTCKALGFIPMKTKIKVKIDPDTLKQEVSKPFWVSC